MKNISILKKIFILVLTGIISDFYCGTLIYEGTDREKKVISEIDLISIDKNIVTFEVGKVHRTMPFSKMLKYYDSDINLNLAFDDNTSDYTIFVNNLKLPANRRGHTTHGGKRKQENKITFDYIINPKTSKGQKRSVKEPYFYLYLLTIGESSDNRRVYTFSAPSAAKIKNTRVYNEALMLEKALSGERNIIDPFAETTNRKKQNSVTIPIGDIGNRQIIAYRLIVWGKDDIIHEKNEILEHRYTPGKNWYLLNHGKK